MGEASSKGRRTAPHPGDYPGSTGLGPMPELGFGHPLARLCQPRRRTEGMSDNPQMIRHGDLVHRASPSLLPSPPHSQWLEQYQGGGPSQKPRAAQWSALG